VFKKPPVKILLIIFCALLLFIFISQVDDNKTITINGIKIEVEIADTIQKQTKGLSGKERLESDQGMLFIFPEYKIRNFWMKEMLFPIDIIWILDNKIIGIERNVPIPKGEVMPNYISPQKINYVLELNANFTDENDIEIGDTVKFNL